MKYWQVQIGAMKRVYARMRVDSEGQLPLGCQLDVKQHF